MKKIANLLFIFILLFIITGPVYAVSSYYKDIKITFVHEGCDDQVGKEINIQLFADGEKVEGKEVKLNQSNNYTYTYEDLPIFDDHSPDEIRYEVKLYENGYYKMINPKNAEYEKTHIQRWAQVQPDKIQDGHTYVFTTDNWNYENNGFSEVIYLRGDITAKGASILPEYNLIDGMRSYYVIDGEPIENTKWVASKVPTSDPYYNEYKDYWIFTNESGEKRLTLTGYYNNGNPNYIFRHTGKSGWVDSEQSFNANRVSLTYVPNSKGRFYIGTHTMFSEIDNPMQYITLSGQNQYQSGSNMENAAQFKAYEYIDREVETGVTIYMEESMCPKDTIILDKNSEFKRSISVKLNCDKCEDKKDTGITLQLFADGFKVEDGEITLNTKNGFDYVYEDLPIFRDVEKTEINYEVKVKNNGQYYPIPDSKVTYQKEKIKKWLQALPNEVKANKSYALVTENLNWRENNYSRYVYLRGDITAKGAPQIAEYNVLDNKQLFYALSEDPIENATWVTSSVPSSDEHYNEFKDYIMFTNAEDKKLTLTGYNQANGINWIFKRSGKEGYYISDENAMYTNKVKIIPVENSNGRFYIGTYNLFDAPNNMMQYLALNGQNNFIATSDINSAAKFIAYHYVERDIIVASEVVVNLSLCEALKYGEVENPNTNNSIALFAGLMTVLLISGFIIIRAKKNTEAFY